jgi:predicted permease
MTFMKKLNELLFRLRALCRREQLDAEMREEMAHHVEMTAAQREADGVSAKEARFSAQRTFGNCGLIQERCRDDRGFAWLDEVLRDVRFAARMLRKNPGFTLVVVLTLALGVGANTALFSILNSVVLQPLPYPEASRLVWLAETWPGVEKTSISYPNFIDWREQQTVFDRVGAYRTKSYNLTGDAEPVLTTVGEMSHDVMSALGIQPAIGRSFTPEEDSASGAPVTLLSDALWRSRYGAAPGIVGQTITLDGRAYTIVGVMPPIFAFPRAATLWVPLAPVVAATTGISTNRAAHSGIHAVGQLKPGVTLEQARANLDAIAVQLDAQYPDANRGHRVHMTSLHESLVGSASKTLWPLFGAAGLVLLIACANVANLLLARASVRQKEMAVRAALGASRRQILRQLFIESLLLAGLGGIVGLLLARWALGGIVALMASAVPTVTDTKLDQNVLIFFASAALVSAVLFGLAPAWHASRVVLQDALQNASRGSSGRGRLRHGLVVVELALTLLLLIGAGLLVRTMARMERIDPGYNTERVLTFRVDLNIGKYSVPAQRAAFFNELLERLRVLPGVKAASLTSHVPLSGGVMTNEFVIENRPEPPPGGRPFAQTVVVERDFFRTMDIPVIKGRAFNEQDIAGSPTVMIDEEFARRYWPDQDPIGQSIRLGAGARQNQPAATIVGVVRRVKLENLTDRGGNVQVYLPFGAGFRSGMIVVMRTAADPVSLVASARQQVLALDPNQPIHSVRTLEDVRERSGSSQRLNLILLGTFALVALGLAAVGLYGVLSYLVAQRQREIGVRMALGARRADVVKMIVRQGMILIAVGAAIGLPAAFALSRVLGHLLFEVSPYDPLTFGVVVVVLVIVALFACGFPARRAAGVDPMIALRSE